MQQLSVYLIKVSLNRSLTLKSKSCIEIFLPEICVFYLMTGAQHFFQQTVKEGVHSEMKIFVFGLATSNELRGGVTKKTHKKMGQCPIWGWVGKKTQEMSQFQ